jgi:hypothetical protein
MIKRRIERQAPRYSTIAYLLHYAYHNDYPKNADSFGWGIPMKYDTLQDREVSALVTCYIYDGSEKSVNAARKIDEMFNGSPIKWLASDRHCDMILKTNQNEVVYGNITTLKLFFLFREIRLFYTMYESIRKKLQYCNFESLQQNIIVALSTISQFSDNCYIHFARRNLFLFMMAHCYNDYNVDESQIVAPLFEGQLYTCKHLHLLSADSRLCVKTATELTDRLRWFSEEHPMTFWVGLTAYQRAVKCKDKALKKLAKSKLIRHKFNKR